MTPDLTSYDWILLNTSGGKDSQTAMDVTVRDAHRVGVTDRLVAVHCDLGRVEWKGTRELAEEQARRYGITRFEDKPASSGARHVDRWLPIHSWSTDQVWARIRESGVPSSPVYELGMPRLSCVLCVFASKEALQIGIKHNPELADEYARVERAIGHQFRQNLSIADLVEETKQLAEVGPAPDWAA